MYQFFNKAFFDAHQRTLLWLLNTPVIRRWFRWVMRIRPYDCPRWKRIVSIQPNHFIMAPELRSAPFIASPRGLRLYYRERRNDRRLAKKYGLRMVAVPHYTADFRSHAKFSKRLFYAFKYVWFAMHFWDWLLADRMAPALSFGFDTLTVYPDAGSGSTTVDGYVSRVVADGDTWANIKAGAGTNATTGDAGGAVPSTYGKGSSLWKGCQRVIATFDTSALTSSANISATVLSFYSDGKVSENGNTPSTDVYVSTPAANNNLQASDYGQIGTTSQSGGSAIAYADISVNAYNNWTFDATGRGNVSKTGISKFALRMANYDVGSDTPTNPVSEGNDGMKVRFADDTGTSHDPKLVITYTVPQLLTRAMADSISVAASRTATVARTYLPIRAVALTMLRAASRTITLSHVIAFTRAVAITMMNAASRLATLGQGVFRTVSLSFMNAASRLATVDGIVYQIRSMSVSMMNAASRLAVLTRSGGIFTRSVSLTIMNAAGRLASVVKGFIRGMSDAVMNAAGRLATVSRIAGFARAVSLSIMNGAARLIALTHIRNVVRAMSATFMNAASRLATVARTAVFIRTASMTMMVAAHRVFAHVKAFVNGLGVGWTDKLSNQGTSWSEKHTKQNTDWGEKF